MNKNPAGWAWGQLTFSQAYGEDVLQMQIQARAATVSDSRILPRFRSRSSKVVLQGLPRSEKKLFWFLNSRPLPTSQGGGQHDVIVRQDGLGS